MSMVSVYSALRNEDTNPDSVALEFIDTDFPKNVFLNNLLPKIKAAKSVVDLKAIEIDTEFEWFYDRENGILKHCVFCKLGGKLGFHAVCRYKVTEV